MLSCSVSSAGMLKQASAALWCRQWQQVIEPASALLSTSACTVLGNLPARRCSHEEASASASAEPQQGRCAASPLVGHNACSCSFPARPSVLAGPSPWHPHVRLDGDGGPRTPAFEGRAYNHQCHRRFFVGRTDVKNHFERRLVGYSPEQLFAVVAQVEHYAAFVPWCQRATVVRRDSDSYVEAELEVGFQIFVERYTSKVTMKKPTEVRSTVRDSTLFHHLDCTWKMQPGPTPSTCWLSFQVEFAFKSSLYRNVADVFFNEVVQQMMAAFEKRCAVVYGRPALAKTKCPA